MHEWRDHAPLRRALPIFGLGSLAVEEEAPADVVELARAAARTRGARDFEEADRIREELEAVAGRHATRTAAARPAPVTRELVYGRNAVRELYRGPRGGPSRPGSPSGQPHGSRGWRRAEAPREAGASAERGGWHA